MNPIGAHAFVWLRDGAQATLERAVAGAAAAGFDLLEVPLRDPSGVDADRLGGLFREHGIRPSAGMALPFDADVSSTDPDVAARGRALLLAALDAAARLGATYLGGVLYSAAGKYGEPPSARGRASSAEILREVAGRAASAGITLGLEAVNRYETNLVNTAGQALALIEEIGAPNVVVHLDTYHMNIEEADVGAAVRSCGERLGFFHASESHRGPLGAGTVDFAAAFGALAEVGYRGPVSFEGFTAGSMPERFATSLAVWRDVWDDADETAAEARRFIAGGLAAARGRG